MHLISERNGHLVGGCSHDIAQANSNTPWPDFRGRCALQVEELGGILRDSKKRDKAGTLNPTNSDIPLKRSREVWCVSYHIKRTPLIHTIRTLGRNHAGRGVNGAHHEKCPS